MLAVLSPHIQPKLKIGQPHDIYEQEADRMAEHVMRVSEPGVVHTQSTGPRIQRFCPECEEEQQRQALSMPPQISFITDTITTPVQRQEESEEERLQAKTNAGVTPEVRPALDSRIQSLTGGGRPLSTPERSFFEPHFGADFSAVRLHDNMQAAGIAHSVKARAFTLGNNVVLGAGEYASGTVSGRRLLAHELTHVIQQRKMRRAGLQARLQRQAVEPGSQQPGLPQPTHGVTIDILDPLNSSLRIGGFSLPSPRSILNGLDTIRGLGRPTFDTPDINWPATRLSDEELHQATCRLLPALCRGPATGLRPGITPRLRVPSARLRMPSLRMPYLRTVRSYTIDHFIYNSNAIPDRHRGQLDMTATELIDHYNYLLNLVGHTDTSGTVGHNLTLSRNRANAVKQYLLDRSVPADQVVGVRGVGESEPLYGDDEVNSLSAARNRRVEMTIRQLVWELNLVPRLQLRLTGPGPAAASISDSRAAILPAQRAMFNQLVTFLRDSRRQIGALIARQPTGTGLLTRDNENITALLNLLDALIDDLADEGLIIRFDQPLGGDKAASYSELENLIHLRRFGNDEERAVVAAGLIHEYTHVVQDRIMESLLRASRGPLEHSREDELRKEIEARRQGSYFIRLLAELGIRMGNPFGEELTARVYVGRFEQERTGTPSEQAVARREIRTELREKYAEQLRTNAPTRQYLIRIDDDNRAWLDRGATRPVDLGVIPGAIVNRSELAGYLQARIQASSVHLRLFRGPGRVRYKFVLFFVFYGARKITEFGLPRPGAR